jgi:indole-3-glycerol phosphate synthase
MNILREILRNKKEEIKERKALIPLNVLKERAQGIKEARPFRTAVTREKNAPIRLIAEIKKASPSKGVIREGFDLNEILSVYNKKDVSAVSVLTDEKFFSGSLESLYIAREKTEKPLLRKDFIIDDYQIYESRVNHADAILLIVAALERSQLSDLLGLAKEISLDCLVEVHDLKELDTALYCGSEIIGINNRDLKTLSVNLKTTFELLKDIPDDKTTVSESGIITRADVETIESADTDAILVGTAIMKAEDIGVKIDELMGKKT